MRHSSVLLLPKVISQEDFVEDVQQYPQFGSVGFKLQLSKQCSRNLFHHPQDHCEGQGQKNTYTVCSVYILNPLFEGQKWSFFQKSLPLRLVSIQERVMMACVHYIYAMHVLENSSLKVDHNFVLLQS